MRKQFKQKTIGLLALTCFASSVFALATYSASAEDTCALTMRDGAAVRIGNTLAGTGIRFSANIDESIYTVTDTDNHVAEFKEDVTEVGMIIVPAVALNNVGDADVFTYLQKTYSATKAEISTQFSSGQIQWDEKGYYVAGAIVSIQDVNLGLEYQAIPYTYDGTNYTYGEASDKRTISYVFNQAIADTEEDAMTKKPEVLAKAIEMNGKLDITTELSVVDGGDLSAFVAEGYVIDSVTLGGTPITVAENVIEENTLDKTLAKKDAQTLAITYVSDEDEQKTLNVNAQVWSLYIKTPADLVTNMKTAAYSVGNNDYGYYKLVNDLEMTSANEVGGNFVTPNDQSRFQGVFDGNGKKINNLGLKYRSLFGAVGQDAVVKDVNFTNVHYSATKNTVYTHSAILGSWVYGGTVENVSVTYTIPDSSYTATGTAPAMCGVLFGQVFPAGFGNCFSIVLKNVSLTALNAESSANTTFAPLGYTSQAKDVYNKPTFTATNVTIVGGEGIYVDSTNMMVKELEGVDYKTGKPVELTAIDTEIGQTVNFADYVQGKEIQSVTYNGENVAMSVTFSDKTQASATPRNYVVTTTDGEKMIVPVTVWSLLIDEAKALTDGSMARASYTVGNAVYGYYKITTDLNMTGVGNVCQGGSTPMVAATQYNNCNDGFQGVFDGGGHTVSNLVVQYRSLFGSVGKDAIFRNVTFANVSYYGTTANTAYGNTAILGSWVNGGTVENVTVTYNLPNNYYSLEQPTTDRPCYCGVLFGFVYTGNTGTYAKINLTNVSVTALNASTATNANFAVFGVLKSTYGTVSSWGGVYFNATNVTVTGGAIYGDLKDQTMIKQTGNGFTYNAA